MKGLLRQKEGERGKRNKASCALGTPDAPRSPCRPVSLSCCLGPAAEHTYPSDNSIFPLWRQRRNSKFHASGCFPVEVLEKQTRRFWGHARPCPHGGVGHAYDCTPSEPLRADWQLPRHPQRRPVLAGGPAPLFPSVSHHLLPLSPSLSFLILSLSSPPSHGVFLKSETNCRPTCIAGHSQHTSEF